MSVPDGSLSRPLFWGHGRADVAFTMRQYVQTNLEVHRQFATTLAELIFGSATPAAESLPETQRNAGTRG